MKITNAIKRLEKEGYKVEHVSGEINKLYRSIIGQDKDRVLEFHTQDGGDIMCIGVRSINDQSDPMTDYCAFMFYSNLSQALRLNV